MAYTNPNEVAGVYPEMPGIGLVYFYEDGGQVSALTKRCSRLMELVEDLKNSDGITEEQIHMNFKPGDEYFKVKQGRPYIIKEVSGKGDRFIVELEDAGTGATFKLSGINFLRNIVLSEDHKSEKLYVLTGINVKHDSNKRHEYRKSLIKKALNVEEKPENKTNSDEKDFLNFTEAECNEFLRKNFGFHGYNGTGLTKNEEDRTLENLRKECKIQSEISEEDAKRPRKPESTHDKSEKFETGGVAGYNHKEYHDRVKRLSAVQITSKLNNLAKKYSESPLFKSTTLASVKNDMKGHKKTLCELMHIDDNVKVLREEDKERPLSKRISKFKSDNGAIPIIIREVHPDDHDKITFRVAFLREKDLKNGLGNDSTNTAIITRFKK